MLTAEAGNDRVNIIDWKLIGSCNLKCRHCYGPPKSEKSLPLPVLYQVVDKFAQLEPEWVVLTGGEPLLVKGIDSVMEKLTGIGAKVALSTNTSFFRKHQEAIERYVSSLNIPLDGSTPEIHERSRQDTSTYRSFFDVLNHYRENPDSKPELLRVGTVFSSGNRGDLIEMAKKLEPFEEIIDRWKIYELMDYEVERELRSSIIHKEGEFEQEAYNLLRTLGESPLASKIMLSPVNVRDKAYFMVNPRGMVVMPTEINGVGYELPLGHILNDQLSRILQRWNGQVNSDNYNGNHIHYERSGTDVRLAVIN